MTIGSKGLGWSQVHNGEYHKRGQPLRRSTMNQHSVTSGRKAARAPVFFWITVGMIALLLLGGVAAAVWLVFQAESINRSGGWGWLLVAAIYVVAIILVCFVCALCTAVSLFRREAHRRWSIVILTISGLVVLATGPNLFRAVNGLRRQYDERARTSKGTSRPPADATSPATISPAADKSSRAPVIREVENPQILELKSKLWEAIRAKDAGAFVDCFHVEERFNTPEIREANRNRVEILLRNQIIDVEIREIPVRELAEIMKIQNAKPDSLFRYSLTPRMKLTIRHEPLNGRVGRSFLIGEQNGKWHIVTIAGHGT